MRYLFYRLHVIKFFFKSDQLIKVLELVLAIGNFLNANTFRGEAYGFKIDSLLRMIETRSTKIGQLNLMHYLALHIEEKYPNLKNFALQLNPEVTNAAKSNLQQILSDVENLKKSFQKLETEMKQQEKLPKTDEDKYLSVMVPFTESLRSLMKEIEQLGIATTTKFNEVATYYGENPQQAKTEIFF